MFLVFRLGIRALRFQDEIMRKQAHNKLVQEGEFVVEVPVELLETEGGWSPYLSVDDAKKLDRVRDALRKQDLKSAAKFGRVFRLVPIG